MATLHDPAVRDSIRARLAALQPTAPRQWGKMTVDQMLWHCNCGLENSLDRYEVARINLPLPKPILKFIVLRMPWRKGNTPTAAEFLATSTHDFEAERARAIRLVDEFAARPIDGAWKDNPFLGPMSGRDWSALHAKHLDHHLKQFGA